MAAFVALSGAAAAAEWKVAKLGGHVVIKSGPMQGVSLTNGMALQSGSVLVATASGGRLPAGRARPVPLHPRHVEKKHTRTSEQTECRTSNSRPSPEERSEREDGHE